MPPDFQSALQDLRGDQAGQAPLRDLLARLGLELDPSTRLTPDLNGTLVVETNKSDDAAAVSALARTLGEQLPIRHKITTKPVIRKQTELKDAGYSRNGGTRSVVQRTSTLDRGKAWR